MAAIKPFGVFVALDDSPPHHFFPGVGFVTHPELAWGHFESMSDVVWVGQRVQGEFLAFDRHNGEARLSLKVLQVTVVAVDQSKVLLRPTASSGSPDA